MVDMFKVESSNVESVGYDAPAHELHVQFISGDLWVYKGVPPNVIGEFVTADSKGKYFAEKVKAVYPDCEKRAGSLTPMGTVIFSDVLCPGCRLRMTLMPDEMTLQCHGPSCKYFMRKWKAPRQRFELEEAK
jgi:hypothetical protein